MHSSDETNPYAVPAVAVGTSELGSDAEALRITYLIRETTIKSAGGLFVVGGILACLLAVFYALAGLVTLGAPRPDEPAVLFFALAILSGVLGVAQIYIAGGLWQLKPWARTAAAGFSCLGLLAFPVGTLLCAYFCYLLLSRKGAMVFSEPYRQVVKATPRIEYKSSIVVGILFTALLVPFVLVIIGLVLASSLVHVALP